MPYPLRPTFGTGGTVTTPIGTFAFASAIAVQPDGKIVVAGRATIGGVPNFALARYTFGVPRISRSM